MELIEYIQRDREKIIKSLIELIRIKSVCDESVEGAPFGKGNRDALNYVIELCRKLGFQTTDLDGFGAFVEIGSGDKLVAILTHLDVVPEGTGWDNPPYEGVMRDGYIIGRGAYDNKGPAIAAIYALKALLDCEKRLKSRVRVYFGCDEETGFRCIYQYMKSNEIPTYSLVPDAMFPVTNCEKGILYFDARMGIDKNSNYSISSIKGADYPNIVAGLCEVQLEFENNLKSKLRSCIEERAGKTDGLVNASYIENSKSNKSIVKLTTKGIQCHASTPEFGINAVGIMMNFLKELQVDGSVGTFIDFYVDLIGTTYYGENLGIDIECEKTGRLTVNACKFSQDENSLSIKFDIRYPINTDGKSIIDKIKKRVLRYGITIEHVEDIPPMYVPEDSVLVKTLLKVYKDVCGVDAKPVSVAYSTYAHAMKNAVGFGPYFPQERTVSHDANEKISVDSLMQCTNLFAEALRQISQ